MEPHVRLSPLRIELGSVERIGSQRLSLASPTMSWGVYDFTAMRAESFPPDGGHFVSLPGHKYLVVLRVEDVFGVDRITLDGSGKFEAWTEPDADGVTYGAPEPLPASIPHQEYESHGEAPSLQDLIVIMKPDIGAWVYEELSCGVHTWGATGPREYFAVSGTMNFSGTSRNVVGRQSAATLTTTP